MRGLAFHNPMTGVTTGRWRNNIRSMLSQEQHSVLLWEWDWVWPRQSMLARGERSFHVARQPRGLTFHGHVAMETMYPRGGIPCGQGVTGGNILHHHGKRGICCYHRGIAPRYDGSTMRSALLTPGPLPLQNPQERMTDRQAKSLMREGPHIARSYYHGGGV